jgi:hypothetical protein
MSNEEFLQGLSLFRRELLKVIGHYAQNDCERGDLAYSRWTERFKKFLGVLPGERKRWEGQFSYVGLAGTRVRESRRERFMRVYGKKAIAFIGDLEEEISRGLIDVPAISFQIENDQRLDDFLAEIEEYKKREDEENREAGESSGIAASLELFREDFPDNSKVGFLIMRFGNTPAHGRIAKAVQDTLSLDGLNAVRADHKTYHDDVYGNVETYLRGCGFGIAIFERLETNNFNPNVALEIGHMFAQQKNVCILKDKTLDTLPTDIIGKLYHPFDPQAPETSIPPVLSKWLKDKRIIPDLGKISI